SQVIYLTTYDDALSEDTESFYVMLDSPANAQLGGDTAEVTIDDNDPDPSVWIDSTWVTEGDTAYVTVWLDAESGKEVQVNYSTSSGSAEDGLDYYAESGTLYFAPGETSHTLTITTIDDSL